MYHKLTYLLPKYIALLKSRLLIEYKVIGWYRVYNVATHWLLIECGIDVNVKIIKKKQLIFLTLDFYVNSFWNPNKPTEKKASLCKKTLYITDRINRTQTLLVRTEKNNVF